MTYLPRLLGLICAAMPCLLAAQTSPGEILNDETFWIGNTFKENPNVVNWDIDDIAVRPDGTVFTTCNWVESNLQSVSMIVRESGGQPGVTKSQTRGSGVAIAVSDSHLFLLTKYSDDVAEGLRYLDHYVMRLNFDGSPAPFNGADRSGYMRFISRTLDRVNDRDPHDKLATWPAGMVVAQGRLYVSDPSTQQVLAFGSADAAGSALVPEAGRSFTPHGGETPRKLTANAVGDRIWAVQVDTTDYDYRICAYSGDGVYQVGKDIDLPGWKPMDLDIGTTAGSEQLYVADSGPESRIHRFSNLDASPVKDDWTLGQLNGVWNRTDGTYGATGDHRFAQPTGVGVDAAGNIYVAENGFGHFAYDTDPGMSKYQMFAAQMNGSKLHKFDSTKAHQWKLEGMMHNETAAPDPADESRLHTSLQTYEVDYNQSTQEGQNNLSWRHLAWSFDPFAYPEDPRAVRQSGDAHLVRIEGQPFLFTLSNTNVCVYRFDGYVAIPSVMILRDHPLIRGFWPANSPQSEIDRRTYFWRDGNGNGLFDPPGIDFWAPVDSEDAWPSWEIDVDEAGNIWIADGATRSTGEIRLHRFYLPASGKINGAGAPDYGLSRVDTWDLRSGAFNGGQTPVASVRNIAYDPGQDLLIAGVFADGHPDLSDNSVREAFDEVRAYEGLLESPSLSFVDASFPYHTVSGSPEGRRFDSHWPECVEIIGDYYFITYDMRAFDESDGGRRGETLVYRLLDRAYVGAIQPGIFGDEDAIAMDVMHAIHGYRRSNGDYFISQRANPYVKTLYYQLDLPAANPGDLALLYEESFEDGTSFNGLTIAPADEGPSGADGDQVARISFTSGVVAMDEVEPEVPLGLTDRLRIEARVGLAAAEIGDLYVEIMVELRFADGRLEQITGGKLDFEASADLTYLRYDATVELPAGAVAINDLRVTFAQRGGTQSAQTAYLDLVRLSDADAPDDDLIEYTQWAAEAFSPTQRGTPGFADADASPWDDGVTNAWKYLHNIAPDAPMSAADRAALPRLEIDDSGLETIVSLTFRQAAHAPESLVEVVSGTSLPPGTPTTPLSDTHVGTDPTTGDPSRRIEVSAGTSERFFLMLRLPGPD